MLAAPPFSVVLAAGLAAELAVGGLDAVTSAVVLISALLVLPPLVVSLTGRWGDTAVLALVALAIVLGKPAVSATTDLRDVVIPLLLVLLGGAVAIAVALARAGTAIALARFGLLMRLADAIEAAAGPEELIDAALDLLVPGMGDVAMVDAMLGGEQRRLGVRGAPGVPPEALEAISRRDPAPAGSAVVVPLRARGRAFGALTCLTGPSGRHYSETDRLFAEVLGGRLALALDNAGLTRELSEAEEMHGLVVDALAEAVTVTDAAGSIVYANDAAVRLLRVDGVDELVERPPGEIMARFAVYDEEGVALALEDFPGSRLRRGECDAPPMLVRNVVRATGEERWLLQKVSALRDPEGRLLNVVNVIEDVTTVKRAERGQRLLARASEALGASLDPRAALQELVDAIVPGFAQCAAVDVPERGRIDRIALACDDAGMPSLPDGVVAGILRDGTSQLWPEAGHVRGLGSMILVPLLAGGEPLGVLTLVNSDPLRRFREEDLALAEELGHRAGVALLNTRSFVRRTAIMQALQHGLLPPALPEVPGWPAAVTYLPAGELSEVGGDFYDIFRGSGGWMLMVGDAVGQGPEAATLSSLARYTMRAAAELTGDPARAIGHLNSVLREQPGVPLATIVCASLEELADGGARLHLASAGHPAPLLVRGEEVMAVGKPGTIAGAFDDDGEWTATEIEMRRGDLLVLYTDGVLDAVGPDDRFGDDRLRAALAEISGAVEERVARLTARLEAFRDGERRDDLTVLMLEYRGAPELSGPQPAAGPPRR